jgi:ribonuclease HII
MAGFAHTCIIGGDGIYRNIAAASILAKTFRDEHMQELAAAFPGYGWEQNAGYPTQSHRAAIRTHGPSPHHRMGFRLL